MHKSLSYFVGIDATENMPNVFLSGDRFVGFDGKRLPPGLHTVVTNQQISWINSWHYQTLGNVLLSDGSVQQATFTRLQQIFEDGNLATNRLVIP